MEEHGHVITPGGRQVGNDQQGNIRTKWNCHTPSRFKNYMNWIIYFYETNMSNNIRIEDLVK